MYVYLSFRFRGKRDFTWSLIRIEVWFLRASLLMDVVILVLFITRIQTKQLFDTNKDKNVHKSTDRWTKYFVAQCLKLVKRTERYTDFWKYRVASLLKTGLCRWIVYNEIKNLEFYLLPPAQPSPPNNCARAWMQFDWRKIWKWQSPVLLLEHNSPPLIFGFSFFSYLSPCWGL